MFVLLNGKFLPIEAAVLSPQDRGFLLGDGVFTTLMAREGQLECFDAHQKRLKEATKIFSLPDPPFEIKSQILKLLESNQLTGGLASVRITITRGTITNSTDGRGITPSQKIVPTILVTATLYERPLTPLKVMISSIKRDAIRPLCHIKHLGYQASILARLEALEKGYEDAVMVNSSGKLVCSTTGNLFFVSGGEIVTPPLNDGALPGIMRKKIIEQHKDIKIRSVTFEDLKNIEGAFITNSLIGIQMISSLEEKPLNTKINLNFYNL